MARSSIWRLAATPKWIGGLFIALVVGSIFAWLGQWQLERALLSNKAVEIVKTETVSVMLDTKNVFIVSDRIQNSKTGYWVVANSKTENGSSVILALGWTEKLETAQASRENLMDSMIAQAFLPVTGLTLPTEAPEKSINEFTFASVSTAQLANIVGGEMRYDYLAVQGNAVPDQLEEISAGISQEAGINWLSAFYAVEWAVFAGFAVFMWWRLLKDAHVAGRLN
jgi:cytochrome oxidase assembly protein ShyY1